MNMYYMTRDMYEKRKTELVRYYRKHRSLPTYEEMTGLFSLNSKGSLYKYVDKFVEDGLVGKSEGGKLVPTTKLYGLRVLGSVQAGFPSPAEEELVDTLSLDEFLIQNPTASYLLQVNGDSMIDAGIMEGDMVIVDRSRSAISGDIVVAQIGNEWTMKYLVRRGENIFLRPANKKYPDIHPDEELSIAGVVTSVVRKY